MAKITMRTVRTDGGMITYQLERKQVKNVNLRIRKDGSVYVSANSKVSDEWIDNFVAEKGEYVLSAIEKFGRMEQAKGQPKQYVSGETFYIQGHGLRLDVAQGTKDEVYSDGVYIYLRLKNADDFAKRQRYVNRFLDKQCKEIFGEILQEYYPLFQKYGVKEPILRIRSMDTRWGSCSVSRGVVTLNKQLLEAPRSCIEYVVMHELCHFIHPNHSKQFYSFLAMMMPDWKERREQLNKSAAYWL